MSATPSAESDAGPDDLYADDEQQFRCACGAEEIDA